MAKRKLPLVYPGTALEALENYHREALDLALAMQRVELLVLQGKTPPEIWAHVQKSIDTFARNTSPVSEV